MSDQQTNGASLLEVENLEVIYNRAVTAIQGVSLRVAEGSITGVVGTNGAGKSTTITAIGGFMRADDVQIPQGRIDFAGTPILGLANHKISGMGIGVVPEREKVFSTMTVAENLMSCREGSQSTRLSMQLDDIYELFPRLATRKGAVAGYLSGGERQMLALAMALRNSPQLMLVDELSLGLAPVIVSQLIETVRRLRDQFGISFLLVEQNASLALEVADYIYVMENGRIVFDGTPEKLSSQEDFKEFYLGVGQSGERSYRDVKQYRRKRRWFG